MTDDRSLERAARSWLESGPTEAPDHAVEVALLLIQTTHQERDLPVLWRVRSMSTIARLAAAVAIAIAVVAIGGGLILRTSGNALVGGPSPSTVAPGASTVAVTSTSTPAPTPTVTPSVGPAPTLIPVGALTKSHVSDRYAYKVGYPATWKLTVGTQPNPPDNVPGDFSPTDFYGDTASGSGHGLMVTSAPVSATRTDLAAWSPFVAHQVVAEFGTYIRIGLCVQSTRTLVVDGEPANEVDFICPGADWLWVTTIHAGRAYQIAWLDDGGFDSATLRPLLDKFLKTFAFTG